jgi:hypothetical protein
MKYIIIAMCLFFYENKGYSQERFLDIAINNNQFYSNDTIAFTTDYVNDFNEKMDGTLYVKILHEKGGNWNFRWPIYKGVCSPKIVVPPNMLSGIYTMYFATRDEKFKVNGILQNKKKETLDATLMNKETLVATNGISINATNSFVYTNPYFMNTAILQFKYPGEKKGNPIITIEAILDSSFTPTTTKFISLKIGDVRAENSNNTMPKSYNDVNAFISKNIKKEEMVTVVATNKQKAKNFEEEHINLAFKDYGERTLNLFEDNPAAYGQSLFSYLQTSVPNLIFTTNDSILGGEFTLRGNPVTFYFDEIRVPSEFVNDINLADVAIIKIFYPPFFFNADANTGAIAIFTKKDITSKKSTNAFKVFGYNAPVEVLKTP